MFEKNDFSFVLNDLIEIFTDIDYNFLVAENKDENIKSELHGSNAESEVSSVQSANDRGKHWESFLNSFDILPPVVTNSFFLSESSSDDWEKDFDIDEIP